MGGITPTHNRLMNFRIYPVFMTEGDSFFFKRIVCKKAELDVGVKKDSEV